MALRMRLFNRGIYKYSTYNEKNIRIVEIKEIQTNKLKELEEKVNELKHNFGHKQIMSDYLKKMIDLAKETYSIDIKKTNTPHSGGSRTTDKARIIR